MTLREFFHAHPRCALGCSGGVDSAYLLHAAVRTGADVRPYFVRTPFQSAFELRDARRVAEEAGVRLEVIDCDILGIEGVAANGADRCYRCKRAMFSALRKRAAEDGLPVVIDGTNASDEAEDRPGMRALEELGVLSPLRMCGMTKRDVRTASKADGLFTWDKPAYACLATRFAQGERITAERLERVEAAEDFLRGLGFSNFRVRVAGEAATLQMPRSQMERAFALRDKIACELRRSYARVRLDLEPRDDDV